MSVSSSPSEVGIDVAIQRVKTLIPFFIIQELEEDPELRQRINIYKNSEATMTTTQNKQHPPPAGLEDDTMSSEDEDDLPQIPLEELLDDLEALQLAGEDGDEDMEDAEMAE